MSDKTDKQLAEERAIAEAGEKRRTAMSEHQVASYRSLRAIVAKGDDRLEVRSDARFLPSDRPVHWEEFLKLALQGRLVTDDHSARELLAELKDNGSVRVTGVVPRASISRPAVPERPSFTRNDEGASERSSLMQVIENLRYENRELRDRLAVFTGARR